VSQENGDDGGGVRSWAEEKGQVFFIKMWRRVGEGTLGIFRKFSAEMQAWSIFSEGAGKEVGCSSADSGNTCTLGRG